MRNLIWLFLPLACVTPPPVVASDPIVLSAPNPSDYAPFKRAGNAILTGQAFLTTRGGDVKLAAGRLVTLDPATPYSREWLVKYGLFLDRFLDVPTAPEFLAARRTTIADAEGRFKFRGLPSGSYIVRSVVTWEIALPSSPLQGGVVANIVDVPDTGTTEVVVASTAGSTSSTAMAPPATRPSHVRWMTVDEIKSIKYAALGSLNGISCVRTSTETPSELDAKNDLLSKAEKISADALINVVCIRGDIYRPLSCMSHVECKADAIRWL